MIELLPNSLNPFDKKYKIIQHDESQIITEKIIHGDEQFLKGHFPNQPIFPGVFILEVALQTIKYHISIYKTCRSKLAEIISVQFIKPYYPGNIIICECKNDTFQNDIINYACHCWNRSEKAARIKLSLQLED